MNLRLLWPILLFAVHAHGQTLLHSQSIHSNNIPNGYCIQFTVIKLGVARTMAPVAVPCVGPDDYACVGVGVGTINEGVVYHWCDEKPLRRVEIPKWRFYAAQPVNWLGKTWYSTYSMSFANAESLDMIMISPDHEFIRLRTDRKIYTLYDDGSVWVDPEWSLKHAFACIRLLLNSSYHHYELTPTAHAVCSTVPLISSYLASSLNPPSEQSLDFSRPEYAKN